jgi:hypothetical protein
MASLKGLAYWAKANNAMGDALVVNVGGVERCMVAEMAPNILAKAAGEGPVPQLRFICDGYCGLQAKRPSKQCRAIDRQATPTNVPQPPGLISVGQRVSTPYRSGGSGAGAGGGGNVFRLPLAG